MAEKEDEKKDVKDNSIKVESLKSYIKNLAKDEESLKNISFSYKEEEKEFICYFAWQMALYNKFFVKRDVFRNNIIAYLSKYGFKLNRKKSTASKYIFNII